MFHCYSGSQNNLHCSCNGTTSNGAAAAVCTGGVLARKVPNHSGASPGQGNKRPAVSLTHLPKRPPVDVEFKNLAYSVSEGRKRGESCRSTATASPNPGESSIRVLAARNELLSRCDHDRGSETKKKLRRNEPPTLIKSIAYTLYGITYRHDVFSTPSYRFGNGSLEQRRR